jgi:Putative zinc-finger
MCDFSGRLIAWLDHELPEAEAINVEWHVRQCAECRRAVDSYQQISSAFLDCYAAMSPKRAQHYRRWIAVAASAAAILVAAVIARPRPQPLPPMPQVAHAPAIAFEKTPAHIVAMHPHHARASKPIRSQWVAPEPTVEVALPADALFPPGAVPAGFSFIADIRP